MTCILKNNDLPFLMLILIWKFVKLETVISSCTVSTIYLYLLSFCKYPLLLPFSVIVKSTYLKTIFSCVRISFYVLTAGKSFRHVSVKVYFSSTCIWIITISFSILQYCTCDPYMICNHFQTRSKHS